jgi:hypothetical protein
MKGLKIGIMGCIVNEPIITPLATWPTDHKGVLATFVVE